MRWYMASGFSCAIFQALQDSVNVFGGICVQTMAGVLSLYTKVAVLLRRSRNASATTTA